jgi:hypothetical protein
MMQAAIGEQKSWLSFEDIQKFPCEDLGIIDKLWLEYSDGRFGLSVQKRIYQSLDSQKQSDNQVWRTFSDRVGWRIKEKWLNYSDLNFSLVAPEGHLPILGYMPGPYIPAPWWISGLFCSLLFRVNECKA